MKKKEAKAESIRQRVQLKEILFHFILAYGAEIRPKKVVPKNTGFNSSDSHRVSVPLAQTLHNCYYIFHVSLLLLIMLLLYILCYWSTYCVIVIMCYIAPLV